MTGKRRIRPGEKVGLKLTQAQRGLLLESLLLIPREVEEAIRSTPSGEPLMFTLDELDDLAGHVAAAANHAEGKTLRDKLDRHLQEDRGLLDTHTDEPEWPHDAARRRRTILDEPGSPGKAPLLDAPGKSKGETYPVKLTAHAAGIPDPLHPPAAWDQGQDRGRRPRGRRPSGSPGRNSKRMCEEVDTSLRFAPGPYRKRLVAVLDKLDDLLDALDDGPSEPGRRPPSGTGLDLPIQGHAQGHQAADLAARPGARLHAGGTPRSHPGRLRLAGLPPAPVRREGRVLRPPAPDDMDFADGRGEDEEGVLRARSSRWAPEGPVHVRVRLRRRLAARGRLERALEPEPRVKYPRVRRRGSGPARPRIAAGRGATPTSSQRWPTRSTRTIGT